MRPVRSHRAKGAIALAAGLVVTACSSAPEPKGLNAQRGVFHNPLGYGVVLLPTNATTEHPKYVVCNGTRCGYVDKDGNFTQMSREERRNYRMGLRFAEQNRRFNEGERFPPPDPPEAPESDTPAERSREAGDVIPD